MRQLTSLYVGIESINGLSQSTQSGFISPLLLFWSFVFSFSPWCPNSLNCINKWVLVGYTQWWKCEWILSAQDGWMSPREVELVSEWTGLPEGEVKSFGYCAILKHTFTLWNILFMAPRIKINSQFTYFGSDFFKRATFQPASTGLDHTLVVACILTQIPVGPHYDSWSGIPTALPIYNQILLQVSRSRCLQLWVCDQDL